MEFMFNDDEYEFSMPGEDGVWDKFHGFKATLNGDEIVVLPFVMEDGLQFELYLAQTTIVFAEINVPGMTHVLIKVGAMTIQSAARMVIKNMIDYRDITNDLWEEIKQEAAKETRKFHFRNQQWKDWPEPVLIEKYNR